MLGGLGRIEDLSIALVLPPYLLQKASHLLRDISSEHKPGSGNSRKESFPASINRTLEELIAVVERGWRQSISLRRVIGISRLVIKGEQISNRL